MPDYAGAVAAIKARLVANWTTTPIVYVNRQPDPPFPPINPNTGDALPVIVIEVSGTKGDVYSFGAPGNRFWLYNGLISLHLLVPVNDGTEQAEQLVVSAAEIFRDALFYQDANGSFVRTRAPSPPDSGSAANVEGAIVAGMFRVSCSIEFEYFHRA